MWRGIGAVLGGWLVGDFWFVACFGWFLGEPVAHFGEWTTGSARNRGKGPKTESSPKSCVKICRLSYSLFAFGEVDQEGARIGLPSIV